MSARGVCPVGGGHASVELTDESKSRPRTSPLPVRVLGRLGQGVTPDKSPQRGSMRANLVRPPDRLEKTLGKHVLVDVESVCVDEYGVPVAAFVGEHER